MTGRGPAFARDSAPTPAAAPRPRVPDLIDDVTEATTLGLAVQAHADRLAPPHEDQVEDLADRLERHGPAGYSRQSCRALARDILDRRAA